MELVYIIFLYEFKIFLTRRDTNIYIQDIPPFSKGGAKTLLVGIRDLA
jgi:hypothetical protein